MLAATAQTAQGTTITSALMGSVKKIWSEILKKNCVKKIVPKCGFLKHLVMYSRKPMQFFKNRSYAGVCTSVDILLLLIVCPTNTSLC